MNRIEGSTCDRRRGLVSVAVLIALIVIAMICAAMLRIGLARRAEVNAEERRIQAGWLLEAGLDRASARVGAANDYRGETWTVPLEELGGRGSGVIRIEVEPVADKPNARRIQVVAEYPAGSVLRAKRTQAIVMEIPTPPR